MARYFNRTRGLVNVTLRTGAPAVVAPKDYLTVTPEEDRSASILSRVKKKLLVSVEDEPTTDPAPEPEPVTSPIASEPEPVEPVEVPSMDWTKAQLIEAAEAAGLEVPSSWTKVEILGAIEEAG